ncbi:hypothetical protein SAMN06297280_2270 [Arsukibacterium tuosuense]|uniref:Uncharacterized protein n=1 Tax=Arsukibacterium tuosuense TaxID=1323745 RepID=A0A285IY50_9GAMM|nr:hypothetical protein [Arsukibacterium tuosuense]SNY52980.1 hypothetical protein SAMN06297280_2270 [Arsukibacterium tuosuense]
MRNVIKVSIVTAVFTSALTINYFNSAQNDNEQLFLDDLYTCHWWPTCRDPDQQKPMPTDSSAPKPSGDKDTTKDNKDETQLA